MKRWLMPLILAPLITGCGGKTPPPPIALGHVASLTGPERRADLQASFGIGLALEEVNKDAEKRTIIVRRTDTQGNLDSFESQAMRLLAVNHVKAILGGDTGAEVLRLDRALQPETDDPQFFVPLVSPVGRRTQGMSKQVILTGMFPEAQGKLLARHAVEELQAARISLLASSQDDSAGIVADAFVKELAEALARKHPKSPPARPQVLTYGAGSLADVLTRLDQEKPDVVLLAGPRGDLKPVAEKLRQLGEKSKRPILLYGGADGSVRAGDWGGIFAPAPKEDKSAVLYLVSAFGIEKGNSDVEDFAQRFRKQFQEEPDVHAALGYEGLKLLADALRRFPEPAKLREELFKIKDFPGLAGPLSFDDNQKLLRSLYVLRLDRDQLAVVKKYGPS